MWCAFTSSTAGTAPSGASIWRWLTAHCIHTRAWLIHQGRSAGLLVDVRGPQRDAPDACAQPLQSRGTHSLGGRDDLCRLAAQRDGCAEREL